MASYDSRNGRTVYPYGERVDNGSIRTICKKIKDAADLLDGVANDKLGFGDNLEDASKKLTKSSKTFKVNGRFYDTRINETRTSMTADAKALRKLADNIISAANSRRSTEDSQWSTYIWWKTEEENKAAAATTTN
jgi:ribosomal protein L28